MPTYDPFNVLGSVEHTAVSVPQSAPTFVQSQTGQPTSVWARYAQVGAAKIAQFNILQHVTNFAKDVANEAVVKPAKEIAKPFQQPTGSGNNARQIMDLQNRAQQALRSGKISKQTADMLTKSPAQARIQALKMVGTSSDAAIQSMLKQSQQKEKTIKTQRTGAALSLASLGAGGGEAKGLIEGGKVAAGTVGKAGIRAGAVLKTGLSLAKKTAPVAEIGAASNIGGTLQAKPNAGGKELLKSAATGYATGTALGVGGRVIGKLISGTGKVLKPEEAKVAQKAAQEAIKVPVERQGETAMISVKRPNAPKLLPATASGKVQGKGFTMTGATDKAKIAVSARLNTINRQLAKVAQGKAYLHPDEVKALVKERSDMYAGKPPTHAAIPSALTTDLKDMASKGKIESTIKTAKVSNLKLGSDTLGDTLDRKTVDKYKADIRAGKPIPPLVVSKDAKGNLFVQDGAHKLQAAKELGVSDVPVVHQIPKGASTTALTAKTAQKAPTEAYRTPPNVEGAAKTSGSSLKIEKSAIEQGLTKRMEDLPEYSSINKKAQAAKVADLINSDRQKAIDIIEGRASAPAGVHPVAIHNGLVQLARKEGNAELITKLAQSDVNRELSKSGQSLSLAAERDPHDPVEAVRQVMQARASAAEKKLKQPASKAVSSEVKQIRAAEPKITRQTWSEFVQSIKC